MKKTLFPFYSRAVAQLANVRLHAGDFFFSEVRRLRAHRSFCGAVKMNGYIRRGEARLRREKLHYESKVSNFNAARSHSGRSPDNSGAGRKVR